MGSFVRLLVRSSQSCVFAAFLSSLLALGVGPVAAQGSSVEATGDASASASAPASPGSGIVSIGGQVVMRLRASAGGMSTQERVDAIEDRLTKIVAVPDVKTSDVIVYTCAGKPPVIYVLGRRLITVDSVTVKSAGGGNAKQLAVLWAKRLQQILPRVDIRLPNEPEPKVPPHPPLRVTSDLSQVEGDMGDVTLRGKTVIRFRGVQPGNVTAAERADMLSDRLNVLANKLDTTTPDAVAVVPVDSLSAQPADKTKPAAKTAVETSVRDDTKNAAASADGPVQLLMGGKLVYTVTNADTKAAGGGTPQKLAESWAKNIRVALGMPPNGAVPEPTAPAPASSSTPNIPAATSAPPPPPSSGVLPPPPATPGTPSAPGTPATPPGTAATASPPAPTVPAPNTPAPPAQPSQPATPDQPAPAQPTTPASPPAGSTSG